MSERDDEAREGASGGHMSALSAAILRIGASLDLDTVLSEVPDGARALTGARCGPIATVDASGRPGDFVTSGLSEDEHRALVEWPDGPGLFGRLGALAAPIRLADLADFVNALVPSPCPIGCGAFQGHADAPPRRACRQLLPRRQGGRIHGGGRGVRRDCPGPGTASAHRRPARGMPEAPGSPLPAPPPLNAATPVAG